MKTSDSIVKIAPALVQAAGKLTAIVKDSINPAYRSKYVSLDGLMSEVRPVLTEHGLCVIQTVTDSETVDNKLIGINVETRILHTSGEWIAANVCIPVNKSDAHGVGSAITYGRRYGLSATLALTADDDDGQAAVSTPASKASARVAPNNSAPASTGKRLYETVPATPAVKMPPTHAEALAYPYPFKRGEYHKVPLGQCPPDLLETTAEWARKTDATKFADLILKIEYALDAMDNDNQMGDDDDKDNLPF